MSYDVIIVGGGMVGATLALALARQTSLSILVLESQALMPNQRRVSAISLASQRIFSALGVWETIQRHGVSPFKKIDVWDADAAITFAAAEMAESVLGYIVENHVIQSAVEAAVKQCEQVTWLAPITLAALDEVADGVCLVATDGRQFTGKLAVAADGARSWLRQAAGMTLTAHDYAQQALVATVKTSLPHAAVARQVFMPTGPLAFLPFTEANTCSIVWTLPNEMAERVLTLDEQTVCDELSAALSNRLGVVTEIQGRQVFPLRYQAVEHYVASRVALVGDAAHMVHPLAGQGVNMGLLDAASLAEVIVMALQKGQDYASRKTLRRYERWRKADNAALLTGIDWIKAMFASEHKVMRTWRSLGMGVTDKLTWMKRIIMRHAVGDRAGLPRIAAKRYTP